MTDFAAITVAVLTEDEEDEFSVKDALDVSPMQSYFEQIDGDFGDPWLYGGSWYTPVDNQIVHFEGTEQEQEFGEDDVEVSERVLARINQIEDEQERETVLDRLKFEMARRMNEKRSFPVYRFDADPLDSWMDANKVIGPVGISRKEFDALPLANQLLEVGRYYGFHELDPSPDRYTRAELSKYLGIEL